MPAVYHSKATPITGTSYAEVMPAARILLRQIAKRTKRRPYLRSVFFKKDKVFLTFFWQHMNQLPRYQRARRLKYLPCAVELIRKSRHKPKTHLERKRPGETFYRFDGITTDDARFAVQIKESKRGRKELMSVFPYK